MFRDNESRVLMADGHNAMIDEQALQTAARALHEALHGKGSWKAASKEERSNSRHLVRVVMQALSAEDGTPAPAPRPHIAPRTRAALPRS
jgi:hypothetical protein